MESSKAVYTMSMSEDELKEAIEFYTEHKYKQRIKIENLKHKTRSYTEGFGAYERDYSEPDGVSFTATDKED